MAMRVALISSLLLLRCSAMIFAAVDCLSDDEPPAASSQQATFTERKRRRLTKEPVVKGDKGDLVDSLRSRLDAECPCRQKTCFRQFLQPDYFPTLVDYLREWHSLGKLDQDSIDP